MYAVVLVGGFGTRLRPLTNEIPKPMLPIVHRPMIVRLVERLAKGGVTDVVLALGFKPEPFRAAFPDGRHGDVHVHYAVEPAPLDTAGAIAFAAREAGVDETFVVANGDIITDLDVARLVDAHRAARSAATIHLIPVADPSAFGVVETDPTGVVRRFVEKPAPGETDSNLINAGTYVLEPSVLELIEPGRKVSIERDTFPRLVASGALAALATDDYWIDAGRPSLYLRANLDLVTGHSGSGDETAIAPTATVDPSARCVDSVVGPGAVVGAGASVRGSVILPGAVVGERATVADSIVAGHVGAGATLSRSVIGAGYRVPDDAAIADGLLPAPDDT
ncbi:MAG TPA: NDP-sugar synthase [Ilumatobacter sp.]|jgi:mannose-1-phosphate guanylyltransferase|nr:NDP-sugar synthase [Ilumatobacter sp.]